MGGLGLGLTVCGTSSKEDVKNVLARWPTGFLTSDRIWLIPSSKSSLFPLNNFAIGLNPFTQDLTLYTRHTMNPNVSTTSKMATNNIISIMLGWILKGCFTGGGGLILFFK